MEMALDELVLKYTHLRVMSAAQLARLVSSLVRYGQSETVLVVGNASSQDVLIDGYKRVAALRELGRERVRATRLEVSESDALIMTHMLQRSPHRSAMEQAWLLRELLEHHSLSQAQLAKRLQCSKSWLSRRLALTRVVPESVQRLVQEGELGAQVAGKYLVPLARANAEHCAQMVEGLRGESVSVRAWGQLYAAYKASAPEQRERIAAHPKLFVRATRELALADAPELAAVWGQVCVRDLQMMAAIGVRVRSRLCEKTPSQTQHPALWRAFARLEEVLSALRSEVFEAAREHA